MDKKDQSGGQPSGFTRIWRLAVFLLCPVYIVWSLKLGSGNIFAWPGAELGAFVVLTLLWCGVWGFAALAYVRRTRLIRKRYQELVDQGLIVEDGTAPYDPEKACPDEDGPEDSEVEDADNGEFESEKAAPEETDSEESNLTGGAEKDR